MSELILAATNASFGLTEERGVLPIYPWHKIDFSQLITTNFVQNGIQSICLVEGEKNGVSIYFLKIIVT